MLPRKSWLATVLTLSVLLTTACSTAVTEPAPQPAPVPVPEILPPEEPTPEPVPPTAPAEEILPPPAVEPVDEFTAWWQEYQKPFTLDSSAYPSFYRGAWGARLDELRHYLLNASRLREGGCDSIIVGVDIVLDPVTHEPRSLGDDAFIFYLQALKREGFRIFLIPNPMHPNLDMGLGYAWEEPDPSAYYHPGHELIRKFDSVVVKWARIAEEYGAEVFLPVLEPYKLIRDYAGASNWLQEILPRIKEVYHGKVWATDIMYDIGQGRSTPCPYDYTGYDFLLSGPPAGRKDADDWEEMIKVFIQKGNEYVADYQLDGFGLYEFGGYTGGIWYEDVQMEVFDQLLSQEQAGQIAEALVRQATGTLNASFPRISIGWEDFDTPSYEIITGWYRNMGDNIVPLESSDWTYGELVEIEQKLAGDDYRDIFQIFEITGEAGQ
jgi:hypothetical protein